MKPLIVIVLLAFGGVANAQSVDDALDLINLGNLVPKLEDLNSPPIAKGEKVGPQSTCGGVWLVKDNPDGKTGSLRFSYQGQRPVVVAFCWLDAIRSRFNEALKQANHDDSKLAFIRTLQLSNVTEPDSYYNRMKDAYCNNGGTFFIDLTNEVRECAKSR